MKPVLLLVLVADILSGAGLNVTETKLFTAPPECPTISRFDVAPNGRDCAYAGLWVTGHETTWAVSSNGRLVTRAEHITALGFTPGGRHDTLSDARSELWFGVEDRGKSCIWFQGEPGRAYDRINWRSIDFSADGVLITYAARRNKNWLVVTGHQEGKEYSAVSLPAFAAGSKTVIYAATEGREPDSVRRFVVVGNQEGRKYNSDFLGWVKRSANGAKLACAVYQNERAFVVENERSGPKYDDVAWLEYLPGSNRLVYAAKTRGRWFIVRDGYPLRERYEDISFLAVSPNGQRLAFVTRSRDKEFTIDNQRPGPGFDQVLLPNFSPDSRRLGYLARQGRKWRVVVDGKLGKAYDEVSWLTWSDDGQAFAFRARNGNHYCVVVNGTETGDYDDICRLWFTPGPSRAGRRLLFGARQARDLLLASIALP
jgi:hypothetical protein